MRESVRAVGAVGAPPTPTATTAPVVADGTVDAITADDTILLGFHVQDPRTTLLDKEISDEPYGITVQPGHEDFVRFVNSVLEAHARRRQPAGRARDGVPAVNLTEIDQTLAGLQAAADTIGANLLELERDPNRMLLETATLSGADGGAWADGGDVPRRHLGVVSRG